MGRTGSGVEVRPGSIRLHFKWDGKRRWPTLMTNGQPMAPTPANVRYAERLAAEIKERMRLGTFSYSEYFPAGDDASTGESLTFGRQLDTWLAAQRIEASTRSGYSSAIKFWKGAVVDDMALGSRPLRALKHSHLLLALATRPGLSGKTVNNYVSVAREALSLAVADGIIQNNPAAALPRASHQKEPPDPFSRDELELILADMRAHYPAPVATFTEFWGFTGLRPSEVVAVRWPSVDMAGKYLRVHEAIVRGVAKANTKTSVSRDVMLNSRALGALQRQKTHTYLAGDHVWLDPRYGTPWLEERAYRRSYWTPTLKRLGIRYRSPRHLRHTYATILLMSPAGKRPAWCATQMGHSIEMFLRTYSKWIKGDQDLLEMASVDAYISHPVLTLATGES